MKKINIKRLIGITCIPLIYLAMFLACKKISIINFSYDLLFLTTLGIVFFELHFFLDIKKMYNWIFKWRVLLAIGIFAFLVAAGYHGSSMSYWDYIINPHTQVEGSKPVLGVVRGIRSDEWMVGTPSNISNSYNNFSRYNEVMNAKVTDVSFYPRLPVKGLSALTKPAYWGFFFLPLENGYSWFWYFDIFFSFLLAMQLFLILTKNNKILSYLGALLTAYAAHNQWWNGSQAVTYGCLALITIYYFYKTKDIKLKLLCSLVLGWAAACFVSIMYPAWMIPYAYFYLALFIYILYLNKKELKKTDILYMVLALLVCAGLFLPLYFGSKDVLALTLNTVYPGKREMLSGSKEILYSLLYPIEILLPISENINPCELSNYISLFPLPLVMAIYYLIKNKKEGKKLDMFLVLTLIPLIFLVVMCTFNMPDILYKVTLLSMSTVTRAQNIIGYISIFIFIYILNKYEEKELNYKWIKLVIGVILGVLVIYGANKILIMDNVMDLSKVKLILIGIINVVLFALAILNYKKTNKYLIGMLIFLNLASTLTIHPISRGLNILFDKPFAKEIQYLTSVDSDSRFLAKNIFLSNYVMVNGGKSIMSTNYVPNFDVWYKLDETKKYENVYNRYAHIDTEITDEETTFSIVHEDAIKASINYKDICKIDTDYVVYPEELDYPNLEKIYYYDGIYVYKAEC